MGVKIGVIIEGAPPGKKIVVVFSKNLKIITKFIQPNESVEQIKLTIICAVIVKLAGNNPEQLPKNIINTFVTNKVPYISENVTFDLDNEFNNFVKKLYVCPPNKPFVSIKILLIFTNIVFIQINIIIPYKKKIVNGLNKTNISNCSNGLLNFMILINKQK